MRVAAPATVRKYPDCRIFPRREPHGGRTAGDDCGAYGGTAAPAASDTAEAAARPAKAAAQPLAAGGAPRPAGLRAAGSAALPRHRPRLGRAAPARGLSWLRRQPARGRAALGGPAAGCVAGGQRGHSARDRPGLRGGGRRDRGRRRRADADRVRPRQRPPAVADDAESGRGHVADRSMSVRAPRPRSESPPGSLARQRPDAGPRWSSPPRVAWSCATAGGGLRRRGRGVARDHRRRRPFRRDQLRQQERARPLVPRDRPEQVLASGRDDALRDEVGRRLPRLVSGDRPAGHEPDVGGRTTAELPARPALLRHPRHRRRRRRALRLGQRR